MELLLVSGGVCEGVSLGNRVWRARWNVRFCSHAPLALGTVGEGVPDALHNSDWPGGRGRAGSSLFGAWVS